MTTAKKIYDTLGGKKAGDGYLVHCPVSGHGKGRGDKDPSLSVKQSEKTGKLIFNCFAGCKYGDIVSALKHKRLCRGIWSKETIADTYNYTDEKGRMLYQDDSHQANRTSCSAVIGQA